MKHVFLINGSLLLISLLAFGLLPLHAPVTPPFSPPTSESPHREQSGFWKQNLAPPATSGNCVQVKISETLTLEAYWQQVQTTKDLIEELRNEAPPVQHARLVAVADQWLLVTAVILPDGTQIPVDHGFLSSQLRHSPPDLAYLENLLGSLLAARDNWPQAAWSPADLEAMASILARPEFQWQTQEPSALAQWWTKVQEWFWDLLGRLIPEEWGGAPLLRYALTGLGVAALGAALFFALRGMLGGLVGEKELDLEAAGDENLTATRALNRAEALAGGGDYRTAVRYLYLSTLLLLEEKGLLRYDRSLTNREYLRSVADFPKLAMALRRVIEIFERVWYGYELLDGPAYRRYADWVKELRQLRQG